MSDEAASLELRSKADIAAIVQWTRAVRDMTASMREYMSVAAEAEKAGVSPGPSGPSAPQGGQGGAGTGAPPPIPPAVLPPQTGGPPPLPGPGGGQPTQPAGGDGGAREGKAPPQTRTGPSAGAIGLATAIGSTAGVVAGIGISQISSVANQAIAAGLGSSPFSFPMEALQKYLQLSTVLTAVHQKFRDAAEGSAMFGTSMGYGIAHSAQLAEQLGKVENRFTRAEASRMAGFARFTGADPGSTLTALGTVSSMTGTPLSNRDLATVLRGAQSRGMGDGRMEEFLGTVQQTTQQQFAQTGQANLDATMMASAGLNSLVYGAGDRRRTEDKTLATGLNSVLTSDGAMKSYLMRAMGYGQKGGPGYVEMKERLDAGVFDSRNVHDLFKSFQDRGMGQGAMFRAIESVAHGSLKANQIDALVKGIGTKEGLAKFDEMAANTGNNTEEALKGTLSEKEYAAYMQQGTDKAGNELGGMAGVGRTKISAGEGVANRQEGWMMSMGSELAKSLPSLQNTIENIGKTLEKLVGGDWGDRLKSLSESAERISRRIEQSDVGDLPMAKALQGRESLPGAVVEGMDNAAQAAGASPGAVSGFGRDVLDMWNGTEKGGGGNY